MSDFDRLEALLEAAAPLPWWAEQDDPEYRPTDPYNIAYSQNGAWDYLGETHEKADAELIVAAVNGLPALLGEVRRLRAENDTLHALLDEVKAQRDTYAALSFQHD